jgi:hypothetical protein
MTDLLEVRKGASRSRPELRAGRRSYEGAAETVNLVRILPAIDFAAMSVGSGRVGRMLGLAGASAAPVAKAAS